MNKDKNGNVAYSDCGDTLQKRIDFCLKSLISEDFEGDKDILRAELRELFIEEAKQLKGAKK